MTALAETYRAYKAGHPDRWGKSTEGEMNRLGYTFLQQGRHDGAIAVFELNVTSYPASANCYDSLAEAHLESGDRDRAIALHLRAVEVDPEFENARRMLHQLTEGDGYDTGGMH